MNEDFLSFVWRYQYFEATALRTEVGEALQVLRVGYPNTNAGPDFTDARVLINGTEWVGCVELHVRSSDWEQHRHTTDAAYESVILHVVWEDDRPVRRTDGTLLPTLALHQRVAPAVHSRYLQLLETNEPIPCAPQFAQVPDIHKLTMLDRVLLERLHQKAELVRELYEHNQRDWEETAYQWLAQHFGFKLNAPAFLHLAQQVPLKVLQKHRDQPTQLEALLFGTAGLLPETSDEPYVQSLQREYRFLAAKYQLQAKQMGNHEWKFLRLRPAGFPTVRLAQLASLLQRPAGIFGTLTRLESAEELRSFFRLQQSEYWQQHYQFGKPAKSKVPALGQDAANLLIINAAVPLLVAYAQQQGTSTLLDRALRWLEQLPTEDNYLIRQWGTLGMRVKTAADSQALLAWHRTYCTPKRCLDCAVGVALLRPTTSG